jgi:antitoxin YefM
MAIRTTYTEARANFARLWNKLEEDQDIALIERRGHETMALMPAAEASSLLETAHLLRSPRNAQRLLAALQGALSGEGTSLSVERLKEDLGLAP